MTLSENYQLTHTVNGYGLASVAISLRRFTQRYFVEHDRYDSTVHRMLILPRAIDVHIYCTRPGLRGFPLCEIQ